MPKLNRNELEYLLTPVEELEERNKSDLGTQQANIAGIALGFALTSITDDLGGYD